MITCKKCHKDKPESDFSIYKSHGREHYKIWCKPCSNEWYREYRKNGKKPQGRVYNSKHDQEIERLKNIGVAGLIKNLQDRGTK